MASKKITRYDSTVLSLYLRERVGVRVSVHGPPNAVTMMEEGKSSVGNAHRMMKMEWLVENKSVPFFFFSYRISWYFDIE